MLFGYEWYWILAYIAAGVCNTLLLKFLINHTDGVKFDARIISVISLSIGYLAVCWIPGFNFMALVALFFTSWFYASSDTESDAWYNKRIVRAKE